MTVLDIKNINTKRNLLLEQQVPVTQSYFFFGAGFLCVAFIITGTSPKRYMNFSMEVYHERS
jgi:hypothetical protein